MSLQPLKTDNEKYVWKIIWNIFNRKNRDCYVLWEDIHKKLQNKITKRQFSGVMSSLAKKGYIFSFKTQLFDDVEVSCDSIREMTGRKPRNRACNTHSCSCQIDDGQELKLKTRPLCTSLQQ